MEKQNVPVEITPEWLFVKREGCGDIQEQTDHFTPSMPRDNIQTCAEIIFLQIDLAV